MKKVLILLAFITLPVITFGQNASEDTLKQEMVINTEINLTLETESPQITFGTYSKSEVNNISYKKSNELISIKAYRRSLQIKTKEIKSC